MQSKQKVPPVGLGIHDPKTTRKGLQIFVGILFTGYLAQFIGLFLLHLRLIAQSDFSILHLLQYSLSDHIVCLALPLAAAAWLRSRRPYVSLGMLLGFGFYWAMLSA